MDHYQRTTQLGPAVAAVAPVILVALVTFRFEDLPRSLVTLGVTAGLPLVIMRLVRDRGNKVEGRLWERWGGQPTAIRLRWSSAQDQTTHVALHRRVQGITGVKLPKAAAERADPQKADATYRHAVSRLRELTRDHSRHHRVFTELVEYSTARNLLGVKPVGLAIAVFVLVFAGAASVLNLAGLTGFAWLTVALSAGGAILATVLWIAVITPAYVERPAGRYAEALLGAVAEPDERRSR